MADSFSFFIVIFTFIKTVMNGEVRHEDIGFPFDQIVDLPVSKFPEPECSYHVQHEGSNGPKLIRYYFIEIPFRITKIYSHEFWAPIILLLK